MRTEPPVTVWDGNERSRRAFDKTGFRLVNAREAEASSKGRTIDDPAIFRDGAWG